LEDEGWLFGAPGEHLGKGLGIVGVEHPEVYAGARKMGEQGVDAGARAGGPFVAEGENE